VLTRATALHASLARGSGISGSAKESSAWRALAEKTPETKPPDSSAQIETF
jgi:hypothetical protein